MEQEIKEEQKESVSEEETKPVKAVIQEVMYYEDDIKIPLEKAIEMNLPALLVGETGTGKTSFIRDLAKKHGKQLIRINLTGQTGVEELIGKILARDKGTYWVNGLLTIAMEKGHWIVLDEVNMALPEILSKLHSLLDDDKKIVLNEHKGEIIRPHKDFRLFGTMNPSDDYAGTKELNKAFISRFSVVIECDYSDNEAQILTDRTGIDIVSATDVVAVAREIRQNKKQGKITYPCSTRDLIYACSLIMNGVQKPLAFKTAIINKAPNDERAALEKVIELISKEEFTIKKQTFTSIGDMVKKFEKVDEMIKEKEKELTQEKKEKGELNKEITALRKENDEINSKLEEYQERVSKIKGKLVEYMKQK